MPSFQYSTGFYCSKCSCNDGATGKTQVSESFFDRLQNLHLQRLSDRGARLRFYYYCQKVLTTSGYSFKESYSLTNACFASIVS